MTTATNTTPAITLEALVEAVATAAHRAGMSGDKIAELVAAATRGYRGEPEQPTTRYDPAATYTHNGRPVDVLGTDSDPRATWWICYRDDPDTGAFVLPTELEVVA